jgi:signal transduction histidine kinase/CheY-like chemotaxis protein/HPt (histidine-containing phosphotransfer) domain-containing protein
VGVTSYQFKIVHISVVFRKRRLGLPDVDIGCIIYQNPVFGSIWFIHKFSNIISFFEYNLEKTFTVMNHVRIIIGMVRLHIEKAQAILRQVSGQMLIVFAAFAIMAFTSYFFVGDIERKHLFRDAEKAISSTHAYIEADLMEPETTLGIIAETIRDMILKGSTFDEVSEYITFITNYMLADDKFMSYATSVYGFFDVFDGKFHFGTGWIPQDDFVPQNRPWYKAAIDAGGTVGITEPYLVMSLGVIAITYARQIFDEDGRQLGVVCLDVMLDRIREYATNTFITEGSYGILADKELNIIAHPHNEFWGRAVHEINIGEVIADILKQGETISERRAIDYTGNQVVLFARQLKNGWTMAVIAYSKDYYKSVERIGLMISALGLVMSIILNVILMRIAIAKNMADERNQYMAYWYESILDTIPFPLSITNTEMKWTFINRATENFLKVKRNDVLGQPCSNWDATICNTEKCGIECFKRGVHLTYFTHEDASYRVDVEMLTDLKGEPAGYIEVVQDITELKQMTMRQAEERAANRAKSAFLARVSHEVRTPMNAILGIVEIQLQKENLLPETQEALEKIHNSGYLLLGIINDILDLSKIEAGKLELTPVNYDVASLIHDTIHLNVMRFDSKQIEFSLELDENIPSTLFGDELRIRQILNNLLSNAFKYTDRGKISLLIAAELAGTQATLIFRVSDTGQGLTQEQVSRLFSEYTRFNMEANRMTEGTGLGMNITKYLVNVMGGEISVESEFGKGSVFTVRLPQGIVDTVVLGKELTENLKQFQLGKTQQRKKSPQIVREYMPYGRVLVVDDVETNLYVARGLMAPYGLKIETVESGFEAIEKIKNGAVYDVVFMDHFMPRMDGIEATKIMREHGYTHPIVALTANALSGQAEIFLASGLDDFISKPIDIRQLNAVLNKLVRDKQPPEVIEAARNQANKPLKDNVKPRGINPHLAEIFARDAEKAAAALKVIHEKNVYTDEDIRACIIIIHGMKSALANIGETELSAFALRLEEAGRRGDAAVLSGENPAFIEKLYAAAEKISPKENGENIIEDSNDDLAYLRQRLDVIQLACSALDKKAAKEALGELQQKTWSRPVKELLSAISGYLLHSKFEEAGNLAASHDTDIVI